MLIDGKPDPFKEEVEGHHGLALSRTVSTVARETLKSRTTPVTVSPLTNLVWMICRCASVVLGGRPMCSAGPALNMTVTRTLRAPTGGQARCRVRRVSDTWTGSFSYEKWLVMPS